MTSLRGAAVVMALIPFVKSQQYAGETITNSCESAVGIVYVQANTDCPEVPIVPGASVEYFKIADPAGSNTQLTLTNFMSLDNNYNRLVESNVQRAVIVIEGQNRDPDSSMWQILQSLDLVPSTNSNISRDNTAVIAPYFPNEDDANYGYPYSGGSTSSALVWSARAWADGVNNQYPSSTQTVSSFDILDQVIQYFDNATLYPNLKQVVVAGHSLGAQMVNRYATVGKDLQTDIQVSYYIANPNSYVWFNTTRPLSTSTCSNYDDWMDGFSNYTYSYGKDVVALGRTALLDRYNAKNISYARSTRDKGDVSYTCGPYTTGDSRYTRFFNFLNAFPVSCKDPLNGPCTTVDIVVAGHNATAVYISESGQTRLFLDNWDGQGGRAYDIGYPRIQANDNPYPDPSQA